MSKKLDALVVEEKTIRMEARTLRAKLSELNAGLAINLRRQAEVTAKTRTGAVLVYVLPYVAPCRSGPGEVRKGDKLVVTGVELRRDGKVMVGLAYLESRGASRHAYFYGTVKELWRAFKKVGKK